MIEVFVKVSSPDGESRRYLTRVDEFGVQRFVKNPLYSTMVYECGLDLNKLALSYNRKSFEMWVYLEFLMGLGYSLDGIMELRISDDLEFEIQEEDAK